MDEVLHILRREFLQDLRIAEEVAIENERMNKAITKAYHLISRLDHRLTNKDIQIHNLITQVQGLENNLQEANIFMDRLSSENLELRREVNRLKYKRKIPESFNRIQSLSFNQPDLSEREDSEDF